MVHVASDRPLLRRGFALSLGIHVLAALLVAPLFFEQIVARQPVETLSFARFLRVHVQPAHAAVRPLPRAMAETRRRAATITFARHKTELNARTRRPKVAPTTLNGPRGTVAAAPRSVTVSRPQPIFANPAGASANLHNPQPVQQSSSTARAVAANGESDRGGLLPFGAAQEPVLDPAVKDELQRLGVHAMLIVTVGEDGRTKHVSFDPQLDAQTERTIEALLDSATWDAAVCGGGVSCEGIAKIRI